MSPHWGVDGWRGKSALTGGLMIGEGSEPSLGGLMIGEGSEPSLGG